MKYLPFCVFILLFGCNQQSKGISDKNLKPLKIEFLETYSMYELQNSWAAAAEYCHKLDTTSHSDLFSLIQFEPDSPAGYVEEKNLSLVDSILAIPEVQACFPKDLKFYHSYNREQINGRSFYLIYCIHIPRSPKMTVTGKDIMSAEAEEDENYGGMIISIEMKDAGATKWRRMTARNIGRNIAIAMDDMVVSCPRVNDEITNGKTQIGGAFTKQEAELLAARINACK